MKSPLYRAMMIAFQFRGWSSLAKGIVFALAIIFAFETLGLSIFWLNGGGW